MRKMKKIRNSFKYAIEGIWTSFKTERNLNTYFYNDIGYNCRYYTKN